MKKVMLILLSVFIILAPSCDFFTPSDDDGKIYLLAFGLEYNEKLNKLENTLLDMRGVTSAFEALAKNYGKDYEIVAYTDDDVGLGSTFSIERITTGGIDREVFSPMDVENVDDELLAALDASFSTTPMEGDIFILYYAGHGEDGTGAPVIYYEENDGKMNYKTLPLRKLIDYVQSHNSNTLMIMDSCYSGMAVEEDEIGDLLDPITAFGNLFSEITGKENAKFKDFVITAAHYNQLSYDSDPYIGKDGSDRHGAFTYQVLKYLGYDFESESGVYGNNNRTITVSGMYESALDGISSQMKLLMMPDARKTRYDLVLFSPNFKN